MPQNSQTSESYVQVAPNSTGQAIRNWQISVVQPGGAIVTALQQVVSIADINGNPIDFVDIDFKTEMLDKLDRIIDLLQAAFTMPNQ